MKNSTQFQNNGVTVVIATLGGCLLEKTIFHINIGTVIPDEILICIPVKEGNLTNNLTSASNVKIIKTNVKGQVAQRAVGFQNARNNLVLQLDDDILLRKNCLENLINCMGTTGEFAVGPKLYDLKSGLYHSFSTPDPMRSTLFQFIYVRALNGISGYQPGCISKAGINMGLPDVEHDYSGIEWLPGACILHRKHNLILSNFYPLQGKAFAEDLFHSYLLIKKNIILKRSSQASCEIDFSSGRFIDIKSYIKQLFLFVRAMKIYIKMTNRSYSRFYSYLILNHIKLFIKKLGL